jgi:hypothetical protein
MAGVRAPDAPYARSRSVRSASTEMRMIGPLTGADARANLQPPTAAIAVDTATSPRIKV